MGRGLSAVEPAIRNEIVDVAAWDASSRPARSCGKAGWRTSRKWQPPSIQGLGAK